MTSAAIVLVFGDLDYSSEECHLSRSTTCVGVVYMCFDYVHLDYLSDIGSYRTAVKPQRTTNPAKYTYGLKSCIQSALRKSS